MTWRVATAPRPARSCAIRAEAAKGGKLCRRVAPGSTRADRVRLLTWSPLRAAQGRTSPPHTVLSLSHTGQGLRVALCAALARDKLPIIVPFWQHKSTFRPVQTVSGRWRNVQQRCLKSPLQKCQIRAASARSEKFAAMAQNLSLSCRRNSGHCLK